MRTIRLLIVVSAVLTGLILFGVPAWAQKEYPKAEVFGGFSFLRSEGENLAGWQGSVAGNFHRNIGFVGDFGGQYKNISGVGVSTYSYLVGPRFSFRDKRVTAFTHFLGGGANAGGGLEGISVRFSGPALACGGGVDVNLGKYVAIRVMQLDWVMTRILGEWHTHNVRYGTGVVFRFGGP